jgi:hypothetical protein
LQRLTRVAQALEAFAAFNGFQAAQAAIVDPRVKYSVWRFVLVSDDKLCESCLQFQGDEYELEDPDDLLGMFEYGEFLDLETFAPNVHPNCRCLIVKVEDVLREEKT